MIIKILNKAIYIILILILVLIILIGSVNIFSRYFFNYSASWADESMRHLFISLVCLGLPTVVRDREEIRLDLWHPKTPIVSAVSDTSINVCGLIFFIIASTTTFELIIKVGNTLTDGLRIPIGCIYFIAFSGYLLSSFFMIIRLLNSLKDLKMLFSRSRKARGRGKWISLF